MQQQVRIAGRSPSGDEDDETTALLPPQQTKSRGCGAWINYLFFLIAFAIVFVVVGKFVPRKPRNVILMVSDGFGPASQTFARQYLQYTKNDYELTLGLDSILIGSSRTRSSNSLVTDSAAGATAFACGLKSYNGAIGVDPDSKPCGTILESAKEMGYATGLIVTSRITHATPACFAAHVPHRDMEDLIGLQLINGTGVGGLDLLLGGGECHFLPNTSVGSCRADDLNLKKLAVQNGWTFKSSLNEKFTEDKIVGLFALDHMDYNIDRTAQPSLLEMTKKGLDYLSKNKKGFFVMIEGSRIDMAAHSNDPAAHLHDIIHYNQVIDYVKEFTDKHPGTIMISVSDHETGGFAVAKQLNDSYPEYLWKPAALVNVRNSTEIITRAILSVPEGKRRKFIENYVLPQWMGISASKEELDSLNLESDWEILYGLGLLQSNRAQLGWSTHGHSAVDVNLYAYGSKEYKKLTGNHENTEIGDFIVEYLGLNLDEITRRLSKRELWSEEDKVSGLRKMKTKELHPVTHQQGEEMHFHQFHE